ncbi:MAG: hypothetical protein LM558_00105 [Thermosphaera sp.]|nr:hypothetical protein [Thermosphaera sp.]
MVIHNNNKRRRRQKISFDQLSATGIYLAVCVDNYAVFKSNSGYLKKLKQMWRVDIDAVIRSLLKHEVISEDDFDSEMELFYAVRNGYVALRAKKIPCLERLLTSFKTKQRVEEFCKRFPEEAKEYLLVELIKNYLPTTIIKKQG